MKHRTFIATIVAVAVAITGLTSATAQAGDKELRNTLIGVAAIALIGAAVADKKKRKRKDVVTRNHEYHDQSQRYHDQSQRYHDQGQQVHGYDYHGRDKVRPLDYGTFEKRPRHKTRQLPHRVRRKLLPAHCRVQARTVHGEMRGFGKRCLRNNFAYFDQLPRRCAVRARGKHGEYRRVIFGARCLKRHGYQVARH